MQGRSHLGTPRRPATATGSSVRSTSPAGSCGQGAD
jgi:hypothetical protein